MVRTEYSETYGPQVDDVLFRQNVHRSNRIYEGNAEDISKVLFPRHHKTGLWHEEHDGVRPIIVLHNRVLVVLHHMGFLNVYRCGFLAIDAHLITALVERWRPETHTFHFTTGEATITLEDVAVIWGLPIRGHPIIGLDSCPDVDWGVFCDRMLGFFPDAGKLDGSRLKIECLKTHLRNNPIDEDSSDYTVLQHARCVALLLLGCIMCPDSSGNRVSLLYLRHMDTPDVTRSFSWGSAVLSFLYRELCTSTRFEKDNIGGALQLLQVHIIFIIVLY